VKAMGAGEASAGTATAGSQALRWVLRPLPEGILQCTCGGEWAGGGRGGLRFEKSRHVAQWSSQYLAAWRTETRQKQEEHRGKHELSVDEERHEEEQQLVWSTSEEDPISSSV